MQVAWLALGKGATGAVAARLNMVLLARIIAFVAVSALFLFVPSALGQTSDTAFYAIERIAGNLKQPTGIAFSEDGLLYVLERAGRIMILEDGEILRRPFLDIREKVDAAASFEQGCSAWLLIRLMARTASSTSAIPMPSSAFIWNVIRYRLIAMSPCPGRASASCPCRKPHRCIRAAICALVLMAIYICRWAMAACRKSWIRRARTSATCGGRSCALT